jgi:hypothetical protein
MKKWSLILIVACAIALVPSSGLAQFKPETGSIDGYMVAEYYYVFSHHTGSVDDGGLQGRDGFWFRRIYFTYNNKLADSIKMRLRLEMNSPGDFISSSTLDPYVKDAYLSFSLGGGANLVAGIQGPPSFEQEESYWGWRPLEKTPLDLYKWTSSRDFGISLKGGKDLLYHVMFANGSSNKAETNRGKKVFGSLGYKSGAVFVEAMAQYERAKEGDDDLIFKGFGAYTGDWGRIGVMYAHRDYKKEGSDEGLPYNIFSVFAVIDAGDKLELIGRYDMNFGKGYRENFNGGGIAYVPFADKHEFSFIIGALSYQIVKNVWLMPNIKYAFYKENGDLKDTVGYEKPGNDFYGYFTLYFKF